MLIFMQNIRKKFIIGELRATVNTEEKNLLLNFIAFC